MKIEKTTNFKKKVVIFILGLLFILLLIFTANIVANYEQYYYIYLSDNKTLGKYTDLEYSILDNGSLNQKQMIEDFDLLYKTILNSLMLRERHGEQYGYDFVNNYDKYKQEIIGCNNEFEFYAIMSGVLADVPSCHTQIVSPEYCEDSSNVFLGCYNYDYFTPPNTRMIQCAEVLNENISDFLLDKNDIKSMTFNYIDGVYELNRKGATTFDLPEGCCTITLVNGKSPESFITENLFFRKLKYDEINEKLFRDILIFNDTYGIKCTLTLENINGEQFNIDAYGGVKGEIASIYAIANQTGLWDGNASEQTDKGERKAIITDNEFISNEIYSYNKDDILYTDFRSFDLSIKRIIEYRDFMKSCNFNTAIIDLRENSGGVSSTFGEFIYPLYFSDNIIRNTTTYGVINNESTVSGIGFYYHTPNDGINYRYEKKKTNLFGTSNNFYELTSEQYYEGRANFTPDIYVLVSENTYSAADEAAFFLMNETNSVIIGTNTGGEGYSSYVIKPLPNSGLLMTYTPFLIDDVKRSLIGTSPDVFSTVSINGYRKRINLYLDDAATNSYENRLKWDDVLIKALELIKEKGNDE